jgi:hypothetical protein
MDSSTTNLLIGGISAIATISAAVIYYYTLNELKRQRENTYTPHLFIDKTFFYVQGVKRTDFIMPLKWSKEPKHNNWISEFDEKISFANFSLECYNIGFGTATNVTFDFSYDIEKFINQIKEIEINIPENLRIEIESNGRFVSFKNNNKSLPYYSGRSLAVENNLKHYVSYILPVSISNEFSKIDLPSHFLELLNIYIYYISFIKDDAEIDINIPSIASEIKYMNISNKKITRNLTIVTELITYSTAGYSGEFQIYSKK